jgi:hypothetical protein
MVKLTFLDLLLGAANLLKDVISQFTRVASVDLMPKDEMCSYCYKTKLQMMQSSPYSYYNQRYK